MKQRHWWRWLAIGFAALVLVLGAALLVAVRYFDRERVTALVAEQVMSATGRSIHFDGPIDFRLLPTLTLRLQDVRLSSTDWSADPELLKIGQVDLSMALRPLLSGQLHIDHVLLDRVECLLETNAEGMANWLLKPPTPKPAGTPAEPAPGRPLAIGIDQVQVRDSRLTYRSGRSGKVTTLEILQLTVHQPGPRGRLEGQAKFRDQVFGAQGELGSRGDVPGEPDALPWHLELDLSPSTASLKGVIDWPSRGRPFGFDLDADIREAGTLQRLASIPWPGPLPLHVKARIERVKRGAMRSPHFELEAAGQTVQGEATLTLRAPRSHIGLQVQAASLDLGALLPPAAPQANAAPGGAHRRLFGDRPLPLTAPLPIDLDVDLAVEQAAWRGSPLLSALKLQFAASDQGVEVPELSLQIAGGTIDGSAGVALRPDRTPAWTLRAQGGGVMLEDLARLSGAAVKFQGGRSRLQARLAGHGATVGQLMGSLNGELLLDIRKLRIAGSLGALGGDLLASLVSTLNPFQERDGTTLVNCAVARLPVSQGVIKVDHSIAAETDKLNIVAAGQIDLGDETMDLSFRPNITEGLGLGAPSLARLVNLSGPLTEPKMGISASGLARGGLTIGAAAATGGLSLLGERLLRSRTAPHPCETALGKAADSQTQKSDDKRKSWLPKIFTKP